MEYQARLIPAVVRGVSIHVHLVPQTGYLTVIAAHSVRQADGDLEASYETYQDLSREEAQNMCWELIERVGRSHQTGM